MSDELVTAAVFGDHTQAVVVRNHLEEAGIPAFLVDEWMSQGLFVVGSAVGGVRVQVPADRLEEAVRLIGERSPGHAGRVDWSQVDVGRPDEAEPAEDGSEPGAEPTSPAAGPPPAAAITDQDEPSDLTLREQRASKIVRGTLIGLFAWPVFLLAIWRLVQIASSDEQLRPEYQRKANVAALIVAAPLLLMLSACCLALAETFGPLFRFIR